MKNKVMIVLAVLAAASTLTAQDTMTIRSYRSVNMCTGERRFTIAPYLGNIRSIDSLMSFDITIGFDTSVIRPTDVLSEGTLSKMLDKPPFMNLVVPGEIRVGGFNVAKNMVGDLPVVAIAGNFVGGCGAFDTLSVSWPPSFNEEFKRVVTVFRTEPVVSIAQPRTRDDVGSNFQADSVVINGVDSLGIVVANISLPGLVNTKFSARLELADTTVATILAVTTENLSLDSSAATGGVYEIWATQSGGQQPSLRFVLRNAKRVPYASTRLITTTEMLDSCQCVAAGLRDTMLVVCTDPMVSVSSSVDERDVKLRIRNEIVSCHCDHGQTNEIEIYTVQGVRVRHVRSEGEDETFSSFDGLPSGPYIIVGSCGGKRTSLLILK